MNDRLVTLFGGGGFLGRYAVQDLLRAGARVRIAQRNPGDAWFLKPLGKIGHTQFVAADVRKADSVKRAVAGSHAVVNLVGVFGGNLDAVHVEGARNVAEAAREAGAAALVHISAIGADPRSESDYGRTKGEGEAAVRAAFPQATIIRPSTVFGREDDFINRFARLIQMLPVVPVIRGSTRFQPVYVADVARAIAASVADPKAHGGKTYELGGPEALSMAELNRRIAGWTGRQRSFVDLPDGAVALMARTAGWLPGAPLSWDQWLMLQRDTVVAPDAKGLDAFGITPTPLAAVAPDMLVQYRRHGRFGGVKTA